MKPHAADRSAPPLIRRRTPGAVDALPESLHPVLRRVYAARGVLSADELALELRKLLPVSTLDGIAPATALLLDHVHRGSRILVVGDFDADGATSTALVVGPPTSVPRSSRTYFAPTPTSSLSVQRRA